ncbi:MAG: polyribonucleotide nucleotidyltransferase, partial [Alphaproteobacteria bacterium]|nr:polyribonucleotide nucleotidyltransferase [Alphaproteobacteria bacterium]
MFKIAKQEIEWAGRPLTLETGRLARQADGAVLATYGETVVLATAVGEREPRPGLDFFPLTVHYQEKTSAAGKIPGGFFKREGRPSEKEILTSRLIDRPIRPLFHKEFRNETQVICTVLSHDLENDPDIVAIVAASAALTISGLPFFGPVAAARIGFQDGEYIINPTLAETEESRLDLVVAATAEGVLMVESEADELSEAIMLDAVLEGHKAMKPVLDAVVALAESAAREPRDIPPPPARREELAASLARDCESQVRDAYAVTDKLARRDKIAAVKTAAAEKLATEEGDDALLAAAFKSLESRVVRGSILDGNPRIDGRKNDEIREIVCETGILPRTHGSALFTRGETQALVTATLGTGQDEQIVDDLAGEHRQAFLLHYNFPPYSVNETGRFGFTSRREVGHGKLAWRALHPLLPGKEDFPYTIRLISEITESNGSSSMATVCGSSLALMDAAVPLKTPVAGIA